VPVKNNKTVHFTVLQIMYHPGECLKRPHWQIMSHVKEDC